MSKHTEGPWFPMDFRGAFPDTANDPTQIMVSCSSPDPITVCYMGGALTATVEEALANARLISAAPELLSACKAAVKVLDYLNDTGCYTGLEDTYAICVDIRAAIQKAEGRNDDA